MNRRIIYREVFSRSVSTVNTMIRISEFNTGGGVRRSILAGSYAMTCLFLWPIFSNLIFNADVQNGTGVSRELLHGLIFSLYVLFL